MPGGSAKALLNAALTARHKTRVDIVIWEDT
jgi:hypothetical protein